MKHAHTAGPWTWEYHPDFPDFKKVLALHFNERDVLLCLEDGERAWGEVSEADAALIALAPTAPHDCDIPGCPGAENKRRLEAASKLEDALYELLEQTRDTSRFRAFGIDTSKLTLANMKAVLALTKAQDAKVGG